MTNWEAGLDTHTHTPPPAGGDLEDSPPSRGDGAGRGAGPPYPEEVEALEAVPSRNSAEEAEIEGEQEKAAELETRGLRGGCNAGGGFGFYDGRNLGIFIDWEEELKRLKQRHRKKRAAL